MPSHIERTNPFFRSLLWPVLLSWKSVACKECSELTTICYPHPDRKVSYPHASCSFSCLSKRRDKANQADYHSDCCSWLKQSFYVRIVSFPPPQTFLTFSHSATHFSLLLPCFQPCQLLLLYLVSTSVYILADQVFQVNSNLCVWWYLPNTPGHVTFSSKQQGSKHGHHLLRISYTLRMSNIVPFWEGPDRSKLHCSRTNREVSLV